MKKLLLILTMLVMMLPSMCFADPVIKSDSRTFNPLTGVYDLQGNVFVQFPAHDTTLTITGDATKVYLYAMEVHGQGNIRLSFGDMSFACDKVDVYHSGRTVCCMFAWNPTKGRPTFSSAITNTPRIVPTTVPEPPFMEVPPMIAEQIASISSPAPAPGATDDARTPA